MIQLLSTKYTKHIACILSVIFLFSLAPVFAVGRGRNYATTYRSSFSGTNTKPAGKFLSNAEAASFVKKEAENKEIPVKKLAAANVPAKKFIGGPSQPEMSSFKSVGTDNMVNLFTGDFSYNIPLLDVGGYPVNLFYDGGVSMEQEASWVGLGWNINPGTVSRNMRGVPDDFNGDDIMVQKQEMKPNKTWGVQINPDLELVGIKDLFNLGIDVSIGSLGVSFNNYLGPAIDLGIKAGTNFTLASKAGSEKSSASIGLGVSIGANISSRSGLTLSPNVSLTGNSFSNDKRLTGGIGLSTSYNSRTGIKQLQISEQMSYNYFAQKKVGVDDKGKAIYKNGVASSMGATLYSGSISFSKPSYVPSLRMPINNEAYAGHFQVGGGIFGVYGSLEAEVYVQTSKTARVLQEKPMVGYLYYENAKNNANAVMDFTRVNDNEVTPNTPIISAPQYSYDVFTIQGEGTGGSIRANRNDMGYVRDNTTRSQDKSLSIGGDIGIPGHFGGNFNTIKTPTVIGEWGNGNKLRQVIGFKSPATNSTFENVYFRNPGETSVLLTDQYKKIGGTDLVRFKLGGTQASPTIEPMLEQFSKSNKLTGTTPLLQADITERKKRSQQVSFLPAKDAPVMLDEKIRSYNAGLDGSNNLQFTPLDRIDADRKGHHISEISVTEISGRRYVYGLPVYNKIQKDYTFTVDGTNNGDELVGISESEPTTLNNGQEKDGYWQVSETPAYAHSFLLTGLLSTDYVDVMGDGITEDDLGNAVKFNYSKFNDHAWRTPHTTGTMANFNDGKLSEKKDDKGIISYGVRESWYLHSIESKTMIALFTVEDRNDGKGPVNEFKGVNSGDNSLKRLKKIDLYNKADLKKNGLTGAKPIKTVWFDYSYTLCPGTPDNASGGGKLTLDGVYCTFNGRDRQNKNQYKFSYTNASGGNPSYAMNASDRWGTYKTNSQNPSGMKNRDYPYSLQDKTTSNQNAAAWSLKKILLPSGGQIEVEYESDDYAYVQNRRACNMMQLAGLGATATSITNKLYGVSPTTTAGFTDFDYVFIKVPQPCASPTEVYQKYLQGITQLAFKLSVNMPKGVEYINSYATIATGGYGVYDNSTIWVKVNKMTNGLTPLTLASLEFLREQLPGQAYPGYDVSGSGGLKQIGEMLMGMLDGLKGAFKDQVKYLRSQGKAQTINSANSFVRLNNPTGYKLGGGQRVKSVRLKDNFKTMTGQQQYTSEYGQEYDYQTTEVFNGVERTISSGVASYEPSIGSEENPFQTIVQVTEKLPLGPASYGAIEMPVLDAFFPAASVGYSKVTVRSLNKNTATAKSRSGIGKQVTEYYTAKDFPVYYNHTAFDPGSDKQEHQSSILNFFYKYAFDSRALSQGFVVETNDMHGKMKSQSSYAENDLQTRINYTENFYRNTGSKGLDEKFDFVDNTQGGLVRQGNMGIDIELMTDTREFSVKSTSYEVQAQVDLFPVLLPFWLPFIWPVAGESENTYRAVTTTKVINYHGVLDKVVVIDKGSQVSTQNMLYDAETGDVIVTRTNNEYDKPIYAVKYPAWWAYSGMGLAYKNTGAEYGGVEFNDGKWIGGGATEQNLIESGDELDILSSSASTSNCMGASAGFGERIWAIDRNKNTTALTVPVKDLIYIDSKGKLFTRTNVKFRILRSGKRNMLESPVANITLTDYPVDGNTHKLAISNNSVINASAMEFQEKWQTDNEAMNKYSLVYSSAICDYVEVSDCNGYLEKSINPYLKGLLGNIRPFRNMVFYSDRAEVNPLSITNLPKNGFLSNFSPYWGFNAQNNLVPDVNNSKWKESGQMTRYNVKGLELESKDALDIYSAVQYGYHRTLPTAVTNNSRYEEMAYEGFEDNAYSEALNVISNIGCGKKHADFIGMPNTQVVSTDGAGFNAHSGKYVLGVNANSTAQRQYAVQSTAGNSFNLQYLPGSVNLGGWQGTVQYNTVYRYCDNTFKDSVVDALNNWIKYDFPFSFNGSNPCNNGASVPTMVMHFYYIPQTTGNYAINSTMPTPGGGTTRIVARVNATPEELGYTNFLNFPLRPTDQVFNHVTGNNFQQCGTTPMPANDNVAYNYYMCAGHLYEFVLYYTPNTNTFATSCFAPYIPLWVTSINITPHYQYYQKVQQVDNWCNYTKPIAATDDMFNPAFTVPADKQMIFSAWVREDCSNCAKTGYTNNQVKLQFNDGSSQTTVLTPAGPIIDGWQRYEGEFKAPATATTMTLSLINNSSSMIYFDDIRIHPYNANMKSYVYDAVNLRLVAELDANNYASFYEYDEEGGLIRSKIETREGIKTLKETRSFQQRSIQNIQQ